MRQRLINFAFQTSIVLFVVFAVAWPVTHTVGYTGVFCWRGRAILLDTCRGEISLWTAPVIEASSIGGGAAWTDNTLYDRARASTAAEWYVSSKMDKQGLFVLGVGLVRSSQLMPPIGDNVLPQGFGYGIVIPYWLLCAATIAWPIARSIHQHRLDLEHARLCEGLCPKCGYDMRASPERCPECGTARSVAWHS